MSTLSQLLAQHRQQLLPQIAVQKKVSLLYPLSSLPEGRLVLAEARRSLEELVDFGFPSLSEYASLFEDTPSRRRSFLSATEAKQLDTLITSLLFVLGGVPATDRVTRVLEFLVSQYEIHIFLCAEMAVAFLPQVESELFVRLVQLCPSFPEFLIFFRVFLDSQKTSPAPRIPRQLLVDEGRRSAIFLKAIMEMFSEQKNISDSHLAVFMSVLLSVLPGHREFPTLAPSVIAFVQHLVSSHGETDFSLALTAALAGLLGHHRVDGLRKQLLRRCDVRSLLRAVAVLCESPEDAVVVRELKKRMDKDGLAIDQIWASETNRKFRARAKLALSSFFGVCEDAVEETSACMEISASTDVEMAAESSDEEEISDRPGGPRIMAVEIPAGTMTTSRKFVDVSRFFAPGDANLEKTEKFVSALVESEITDMGRDLETSVSNLEISDEYVRLCVAMLRTGGGRPGNLVQRVVEVEKILATKKKFPGRKLLEKIVEDFWFAEYVTSDADQISDFVKLAVKTEDVKLKMRLLQIFRSFEISGKILVSEVCLDHLHVAGNWKWLENLAKWVQISDKISVQKIVAAFELVKGGVELGQAADCLRVLLEISSAKFLPFFNRLSARLLDALVENFAISNFSCDEELLVSSRLLRLLGTLGNFFGAYFSEVRLVRRLLLEVLFSDHIEQEEELDEAKEAVVVNILAKCSNNIVLEILKEICMQSSANFVKAVLTLQTLLEQENFQVHEQLGVLLVKVVLAKLPTSIVSGNSPKKWSEISDFAAICGSAISGCFSALALRLTLPQLDVFVRQLVAEIRNSSAVASSRRWVLLQVCADVFTAGGEAATMAVLPVVTSEILAGLKSRETALKGKRRANLQAISDPVRVAALKALKSAVASEAEISEDTMAEFVEETTNLVGVEEEATLVEVLKELAEKTSDALRKTLAGHVIRHARDKSSNVRLAAARISTVLWKTLGEAMNIAASETLVFASELCEDEDDEVEEAARLLIKEIERITGEKIADL